MQDMSPTTTPVPERKKSEDELLLDLFAEIAMRGWYSAKRNAPLTHRQLEALCKEVHASFAATEATQRAAIGIHDGADADALRKPRAHLLKCHNALWRRISAHEAATRVSKMKPDGYIFNPKKLPYVATLRATHGALYASFRDAAIRSN